MGVHFGGILPIDRKEVYCLKKLFGCYLLAQFPRDDMPHIMDEVPGEAAKVACEEASCLIWVMRFDVSSPWGLGFIERIHFPLNGYI